jgi:DNA replication and repair protein RecF
MQLKTLQLIDFRNYAEARVDFSPKINVLTGRNGSGKTNLLDAIYYLSMTRSAVSPADNYCVRQGQQQFFIRGTLEVAGDTRELSVGFQSGSRKVFRDNGSEYQKISDHIGKYPVVLVAPDDTDLVREGSDARRRFFDSILSQIDRAYLDALIQYNQAMRQRNSLLKMFAENNQFDSVAIDVYNELLIRHGSFIYRRRLEFVEEYRPVFRRYYNLIVSDEDAGLQYNSELNGISFQEGLATRQSRDLALQRTTFGIHRDDYHFTLGEGDLKRLGSQGQQKSFVIALKLAHFDLVRKRKGFPPMVLLDDIFDKLDDFRIERLLKLIREDEFGQLFITDARPERTTAILKNAGMDASFFKVEHNSCQRESF